MTLIMGVVNVTPDSFSDGGLHLDADAAIAHGLALASEGAAIIDVGGESTRPGAERVAPALEQQRVLPVVTALAEAGVTVSIDTMNATTARAAVAAGARIVNDVSGGLSDPEMLPTVAGTVADIVLQHWRGASADMYAHAQYTDIVSEVIAEIEKRVTDAVHTGISRERLIVDPGIGFGKRGDQNWEVLRGLERIVDLGHRVLLGTSRKRMFAELLGEQATLAERDLATAVTSVRAAEAGVWAVRVHNVAATRSALAVWHASR